MTLPTSDTAVIYPSGSTDTHSTVVHVVPLEQGQSAVLLEHTPVHPVDTAWPDQPCDRGVLHSDIGTHDIINAVTAGIHEGQLYLGADLPVRTGTEGWTFVVAHIVNGPAPEVGSQVRARVDEQYRAALSAGHTACHLASLALDEALADVWTKPAPTDALGNPGFDALAIQSSRIQEYGSHDVYRLGKSLRRKGFPADGFADPDAIADRVNECLASWIAAGGAVQITTSGPGLSSRRYWECDLPQARVSIPCGGTHVRNIADLIRVSVTFETLDLGNARQVHMHTRVHAGEK